MAAYGTVTAEDIYFPGDIVTFNGEPALYKVMKINPTKVRALREDGEMRLLQRGPWIKKASGLDAARFVDKTPEVEVGMVVTNKSGKFPGLWVVIKVGGGRVSTARLGGGLGFTGPVSGVQPVDEVNNFGKE